MAFAIGFTDNETCDICRKKTAERTLEIFQRTKDDRNIMYLHESCLQKKIARLKVVDAMPVEIKALAF